MPAAHLRLLAFVWFGWTGLACADQVERSNDPENPGAASLYELSRQDVTVPIATAERSESAGAGAISVPVENVAAPMRCMAAWSFLAGRIIPADVALSELHPDFREATASSHWQHWLKMDFDQNQGGLSADFHQRRTAAERAFGLMRADHGERSVYRTLGTCYVPPIERQIADPTILLRNFMIEHQGLPEQFAVPTLQRQLRAFPITEMVEADTIENCDSAAEDLQAEARLKAVSKCFERGGILSSQTKTTIEDLGGACRATSSVQCENIP